LPVLPLNWIALSFSKMMLGKSPFLFFTFDGEPPLILFLKRIKLRVPNTFQNFFKFFDAKIGHSNKFYKTLIPAVIFFIFINGRHDKELSVWPHKSVHFVEVITKIWPEIVALKTDVKSLLNRV
jgi:hypothetical protein